MCVCVGGWWVWGDGYTCARASTRNASPSYLSGCACLFSGRLQIHTVSILQRVLLRHSIHLFLVCPAVTVYIIPLITSSQLSGTKRYRHHCTTSTSTGCSPGQPWSQ